MKKIFGVLMIGAAVVFAAGNAHASFAIGDLIRVVDSSTGADLATDLGSLTSVQSGATALTDAGNGVSTSTYTGVGTLSNDTVYYFVYEGNTSPGFNQVYAASTNTSGTLAVNTIRLGGASAGAITALQGVVDYYAGSGGTTVYTPSSTGFSDYLEINSGPTSVAGLFTSSSDNIGASLANLASTSANTDLWSILKGGNPVTSLTGLDLTTSFDGTNIYTTDNISPASPTPIPPSMLLFVPGLLGLIGLKRRISA